MTGTAGEWPSPNEVREVATGRWHAAVAVALLGAALGVLAGSPAAVLAGTFGVVLAAYAQVADPPPTALSVERTLSPPDPNPGDVVTVTAAVRNAGDALLPDLAVYDGVPSGISVVEGTARLGTALRPGETATVTYAVRVPPGEHAFRPPLAVVRDVADAVERSERVTATGADAVTAEPSLAATGDLPLRPRDTGRPGPVPLATGGEGVAFHAVREYRRGDPPGRIDWARAARTGELATITYRESRAARVVVVVDARRVAYAAPAIGEPTAVARGVDAAGTVVATLLSADAHVGLAALSPRECWVPPGAGDGHRERLRRRLVTDPALSADAPAETSDVEALADSLRTRLSGGTQVVLLTPLVDDGARAAARRLDASGYPVTVVSPDVTTGGTPGRTLASLERRTRIRALRAAGLPVVDWPDGEALSTTLVRKEWSG